MILDLNLINIVMGYKDDNGDFYLILFELLR